MTLGIVKMNSRVTSKLPIIKKKLPCDNRISYEFLLYIGNKNQCLQCLVSLINYFLLLVLIIQCIVTIGLVTENFIPNY